MKDSVLLRDQRIVNVTTSDTVLVQANRRRRALLVSSPFVSGRGAAETNAGVGGADTGTGGVKLTATPGAGKTRTIYSASAVAIVAGTPPVLAFGWFDGATFYRLASGTPPITWNGALRIAGTETARWQVVATGAGSTTDFTILGTEDAGDARVTLSFTGPAVIDQGLTLYQGGAPLQLVAEYIGRAIREEIRVIGSVAATIGIVDVFEP